MKAIKSIKLALTTIVISSISLSALASDNYSYYSHKKFKNEFEITVTNLTYNQIFSPLLAVSHRSGIQLFTEGEAASEGIATMAESGDVSVITDSVAGNRLVRGSNTSAGPLLPGQTTTITVPVNRANRLSLVSMLVNTNDAFLALNSISVPRYGHTITKYAVAFDAGTEPNDELCANIPGPACGGEGFNTVDGEGFVHIHRGIHGIGDLDSSIYDWRNPVAKITIRRK